MTSAILNAMASEAVQMLIDRGIAPEVYVSSNATGGDEANARSRRAAAEQ